MGQGVGDPASGDHGRPGLVRRAAWSFLAQTASSASNFLLSVFVLAVASASEFAVFAICLTTYAFLLQLIRATVGVPVTLLHSDSAGRNDHHGQSAAVGASVVVGILAGALIVCGAALAPDGRGQLVVVGVCVPFLLWQDTLRYVCFARSCPATAASGDCLWIALQVIGFAVLLISGRASALTLLGTWAGAGTISAFFLGVRTHLPPRLAAGIQWTRDNRELCARLLAEFVIAAGSHYAVYYGLAIVAGAGEFGRLKGAQTLLGPVVVLLQGGGLLGVPESVRAADDPARLRRLAAQLSVTLAVGSLACGVVTYALLPTIGPVLFPHAWAMARPLLPLLTVFCITLGVSTGSTAALRARGHTAWLLRIRTQSGVVLVALGLACSAAFGAGGALLAVTIVEGVVDAATWRRLIGLTRHPEATLAANEGRDAGSDGADRPLPWIDETSADQVWVGGGVPLAHSLEGLGSAAGDNANPASARPGTGPAHPAGDLGPRSEN